MKMKKEKLKQVYNENIPIKRNTKLHCVVHVVHFVVYLMKRNLTSSKTGLFLSSSCMCVNMTYFYIKI